MEDIRERTFTFQEMDSFDEVVKEAQILRNYIVENRRKIIELESLLSKPKPKDKKNKHRKGFAMKRILLALIVVVFVALGVYAYSPSDINYDIASNPDLLAQYLRDTVGTHETYTFTPRTSAPSSADITEGMVYYNDTANRLYLSTDGSTWTAIDVGSGNSLDTAYDLGNKIDVDGTVLELEVDDGSNNSALYIDHDEATNDNVAIVIENAADAGTAVSIQIDGTAGYDIQGTGDTWEIEIDGTLITSGGFTIEAADCLWDDTYDMFWDTSKDHLLFLDNASLGFGGAAGDDPDVHFTWDASNLVIEAATDNTGTVTWGATNSLDLLIYGSTNTNIYTFDVSAATIESNGWTWVLQDDDNLNFGDSDEFQIEYDEDGTDNLIIVAANANDAVQIGDCTTGTDFICVGSGAADNTVEKLWFDASVNTNMGALKCGIDDYGIDAYFYGATASQLTWWDASTDTWFFGADAEGVDVYLYADTTGDYFMFDESDEAFEGIGVQLHLDDDSDLQLGTSKDIGLTFDGTDFIISTIASDEAFKIGSAADGFDVTYYFEDAGTITTDYDGDFLCFSDDMDLRFGTGASANGDFQISSNSSNVLNIAQVVADTGTMTVGADGTDIPITWYAETAGDFVLFTADDVQFEDVSLCLADSTQLQFGDALGTGDIKVYATGTDLIIDGVVAETGTVAIGVTDLGLDFKLWAATDADGVLWDASDEALELTGANIVVDDGSITLNDDDNLQFGDAAEATIEYDEDGYNIMVYHNGLIPDSAVVEEHVANDTMDTAADVGTWHLVTTDAVAITLPAVATGLVYRIMNTGAAGAVEIHVDVNAADKILGGCGFTALDDGDKITNTQATAEPGDYVVLAYGTADGWYITDMCGTWADGG